MWVNIAALIINVAIQIIFAPKAPKVTPVAHDRPTADVARPIPVVFGTVTIKGPNVVWYGDLYLKKLKKKGSKK